MNREIRYPREAASESERRPRGREEGWGGTGDAYTIWDVGRGWAASVRCLRRLRRCDVDLSE